VYRSTWSSREIRVHSLAALYRWIRERQKTAARGAPDPVRRIVNKLLTPLIISLNTCLYIYFIFQFRRMFNRYVESLRETLFHQTSNNIINTISQQTLNSASTIVSFELSFRTRYFLYERGTVPLTPTPFPYPPTRTYHSYPIMTTRQPNADIMKDVAPFIDLSRLQICPLPSTFQHMNSLLRESFNTTTDRQNP